MEKRIGFIGAWVLMLAFFLWQPLIPSASGASCSSSTATLIEDGKCSSAGYNTNGVPTCTSSGQSVYCDDHGQSRQTPSHLRGKYVLCPANLNCPQPLIYIPVMEVRCPNPTSHVERIAGAPLNTITPLNSMVRIRRSGDEYKVVPVNTGSSNASCVRFRNKAGVIRAFRRCDGAEATCSNQD